MHGNPAGDPMRQHSLLSSLITVSEGEKKGKKIKID